MVRQNNAVPPVPSSTASASQTHPTVVITQTSYDRRALTCTDPNALSISLQNLNYLTSVNTIAIASIMAADGGLSLLVAILRRVGRRLNGVREDLDPFLVGDKSNVSAGRVTTGVVDPARSKDQILSIASSNSADRQLDSPASAARKTKAESLDRFIYSTALSCLTNIATRGRQKMKEALVECGIVPVLVELLDHIVSTMEMVQALQANSTTDVARETAQSAPAISGLLRSTVAGGANHSLDLFHTPLDPSTNATIGSPVPGPNQVASTSPSAELNSNETRNAEVSLAIPLIQAAPFFGAPALSALQTPSENLQPPAMRSSTAQEIPFLPSIRQIPQTFLEETLISSVLHRGMDILLAIKIIANLSKYPSIRPHLHADCLRPRRPTLEAMILAASAANEVSRKPTSQLGSHGLEESATATILTTHDSSLSHSNNRGFEAQPLSVSQSVLADMGISFLCDSDEEIEEILSAAGVGASGPIFMQTPLNPRSAFELVEAFTSPSSYLSEARMWAVLALRSAYRRDPATAVLSIPKPISLGYAVDTSEPIMVVVSPGQLRRCAYGRCGKWEERYKQFSKCSRCRRVTYCW
ncbi:hypothetical protein DFJ73DRAFT_809381 [Zopfochytrium polystomum]|nr:hypothetical protein DFJ73DRAFT_809381 [Zopfochytrium polystomum]